jgi:hypothetical protein
MSNAAPTRIGSINQDTGTLTKDRALMLKVFAGEVMTAFEQSTTILDKHYVRTIQSGKSAQFPLMGRMPDGEYHTPGTEITGQVANHAEQVINIDGLLISHVFIADLDDAMNHYDVRSRYAQQMGERLAVTFDQNVYRELMLAARATSPVDGGDDGLVITDADLGSATDDTRFKAWVDVIYQVAENFDNKWVPKDQRYLALKPADYYFLIRQMSANGFSLIDKDIDGKGSISEGTLPRVAGVTIIPTPNLPFADGSSLTFHAVNAATTKAVSWYPDAVGTVKLMDLSLQSEWDIRRQGTLMVARYAMGHGALRPECAVEIRTAAPTP